MVSKQAFQPVQINSLIAKPLASKKS